MQQPVLQRGKKLTRCDLGDLSQCPAPRNRGGEITAPEPRSHLAHVPDSVPGTLLSSLTIVFQTSQFHSCHDEQLAKGLLEPATKDARVEAPLSVTWACLAVRGPPGPAVQNLPVNSRQTQY